MLTTGSWFHFLTIIILAWTALFTLPRVYLNNQVSLVSPLMNDAPPFKHLLFGAKVAMWFMVYITWDQA